MEGRGGWRSTCLPAPATRPASSTPRLTLLAATESLGARNVSCLHALTSPACFMPSETTSMTGDADSQEQQATLEARTS